MSADSMFPPYIPRPEEQPIREAARLVGEEGSSRAVLLYGEGGVGKTRMLREMAAESKDDPHISWLQPIDIDDSDYWLLSNLEQRLIEELDPEKRYFEPYLKYLRLLPGQTLDRIDADTVVSHLDAIKQEFVNCYRRLTEDSEKAIVIVFDTVEVIRGLSLLYTLTEWMKSLPATLFVLSGRPVGGGPEADSIRRELAEGPHRLPHTVVDLGGFGWDAAYRYLNESKAAEGVVLSNEEKTKLVLLTRGYPLWLAFTITYLIQEGVPDEVGDHPLADLERNMPYHGEMTKNGRLWHASYKKRLVGPYQDADFQHEAIKRLAVVRQNVSEEIFELLMADRVQPDNIASLADEWEKIREIPWIRTRGGGKSITLHDAVAEEILRRIIPVHDENGQWRRDIWRRAARIYDELGDESGSKVAAEQDRLNSLLQDLGEQPRRVIEGRSDADMPDDEGSSFVAAIARLDGRKRALDELRVISLHYDLLSDFPRGAERFIDLFEEALEKSDPLPRERLAIEIQRFLPSSAEALQEDSGGWAGEEFRSWLEDEGLEHYQEIVRDLAQYQIDNEQPQAADKTIGDLAERATDPALRFSLNILKGNALMRIPGQSAAAAPYFERALDGANAMTSADAVLLQARAHKDFGFYYRQRGHWRSAMESYSRAFKLISDQLDTSNSIDYRKEMASIERNWAYVNGISGNSGEATNLIESAIKLYRAFGTKNEVAAALSVQGEVYRYGWQFTLAWKSFAEAEEIFEETRNRAWLGTIFQEQAICLAQAYRKGIKLPGHGGDPMTEAKLLIEKALEICREQNLRAYPSALNRAARIFGVDDINAGIGYAEDGIAWATLLSDGWRRTACLVEYVDLNYRGWVKTREEGYRQNIRGKADQVDAATAETDFLDVRGKWNILQGHLEVEDWHSSHDETLLAAALEHYKLGFTLMAQTFVGSSSAFTIGVEFERFKLLFDKLPEDVCTDWIREFRRAWRALGSQTASTVLLARLEELY
jgi:tetratricopeptide (TPR) repeat protein